MQANENDKSGNVAASNHRLKSFLSGDSTGGEDNLQPIADLFPNCTVLFADISGFTAWSSTRDPAQVFVLLQTVYQAFDEITNQRKVFKVETIGDSCMFGHESQDSKAMLTTHSHQLVSNIPLHRCRRYRSS
jgi:class 3 adenylate cyclase